MRKLTFLLVLGMGLLAPALHAAAKAKVKLKVEVEGVSRKLAQNIHSSLSLENADKDELDEERIRKLHADAPGEIAEALQPFGYYRSNVRSELRQEGDRWIAHYDVDAGPPVKIASVDLQVTGAGKDDPRFQEIAAGFPLRKGEVLYHPDWEKGKKAFEEYAAEQGYLDAAFQANEVRVSMERYQADVVLIYNTGPRYRFGEVRFHQDVLKPELLTGYVKFKRGDPLNVNQVLELQSAISDSPYWGRVEVVTRQDEAKDLEVPIDVNLVPSKPVRFSGGLGYGTDTGPRARGILELRRLNSRGHRAEIDAIVSGVERGFKTSYLIPGAYPRTDLLSLNLAYDRLDTNTSLSDSGLIGATLTESRFGWREAYSLNFQRESFTVGLDHGTSNLVVPGVSLERVRADDRIDTTNGYRVRASFQGADASVLSDSSFLQGSIDGKIIRSLGDRNRLIARTQVGYTATNDFRELPPQFRFFAGGDQSVRGFSYQSLGRKDEAGNTIGGETLAVASLEYERRFFTKWGAAVFYDTGNASQSFSGLGTLARGAGFGLRWRSPIGPIRADVAFALSEPGHPIRFHLNIGPDL
ncbi:MAG TPA: autotransporter assembly complex family protein [Thermoanaerobaculia bacterium]|jgi:translocation and assembly module TamA|nr:autotransporter assembly complex family protein [Thermoanaerobaculia bacterium]